MIKSLFSDNKKKEYLDALRECGLPVNGSGSWFERFPHRAIEEIYKMQENTNSIYFCSGRELIWEVEIISDFGTPYLISIKTDSNYPFTEPKVYMKSPELEDDFKKHVYGDKRLCLFRPEVYSSNMSILDIRNITASWIHCYEIYLQTGEWTGAEARH